MMRRVRKRLPRGRVVRALIRSRLALALTFASRFKDREQHLEKLAGFAQSILLHSPFATMVVDLRGTITAFNPAAERLFHCSADELIGSLTPLIFLQPDELKRRARALSDELGSPIPAGMEVLMAKPKLGQVDESEWIFCRLGGTCFQGQLTASGMTNARGELEGVILIAHDITERRRAEADNAHMAHHDALTGLPTRAMMYDRLSVALTHAARNRRKVGLLLVDIDCFKRVNDTMGHLVGDRLLVELALRLKNMVRNSDTVARMGGDEFVIVLNDLHRLEEAEQVAEKLLSAVRAPLSVGKHRIVPAASIGICMYPDNAREVESMLRNADGAMYCAKAAGKNGYRSFTDAMELEATRKQQMEVELQRALDTGEFALVYQPQVCMKTGSVNGVEALLRWRRSEFETLLPDEFMPVAEECGLIGSIGEWVLQKACRDGARLQAEVGRPLRIAVNISSRQLYQEDLPAVVEQSWAGAGLGPGSLELEITESILISDSQRALAVLREVRERGVGVVIDDFGTGYASLSHLVRFPVNRIKVDGSLVRSMSQDVGSSAVVTATLALADSLGIHAVAEGVETAAQRDLLSSRNCASAQGYFYAAPAAIDKLADVIQAIDRARHPVPVSARDVPGNHPAHHPVSTHLNLDQGAADYAPTHTASHARSTPATEDRWTVSAQAGSGRDRPVGHNGKLIGH